MMTKEEHITHWIKSSEDDLITLNSLFKEERFVHAIFFGHLFLEKVCKAVWVKHNIENIAPFTHNLLKLLNGIETGLSEDDLTFLDNLNEYQLEGRYPEYEFQLKKKTTKEMAIEYIIKINNISQCLLKNL
jgi:HEPN domain-containing protein